MLFNIRKAIRTLHNGLRTTFGESYSSLSRIFAYSKPHMCIIIFGNITLFIASILNVLIPVYIGIVLDVMKGERKEEELIKAIKQFAVVLFLNIVLMTAKETAFDVLATRVIQSMRRDLFYSLLNKDIEFYDTNNSGNLISRLTGDIEKVQNSSTNDIANFVRRIIELCGSFFLLLSISPKLTFALFGFIPLKVFLIILTGRTTKTNSKKVRNAVSEANSVANEAFQNIRVIKAFSTEDKEFNQYSTKLDVTSQLEMNSIITGVIVSTIRTTFGFGGLIFMIWTGGNMVIQGTISAGNLSTFMLAGINASSAFNSIDKIIKRFAGSLGACERIFEILDYEPRIPGNYNGEVKKDALDGDVTLKDLTFSYPTKRDVTVIKQIDVEILKGETIALVGASGSGKSTITNLIQRFYDASKGQVLIDGENIAQYNLKWFHQQIGYVPQEPSLFSGTIEDNITYGVTDYTKEALEHAISMANAGFVYEKMQFPLGLKTVVGERGTKLSGGQKQRIAIARAVIKNPKILIFDEATSALDAESEHQVQTAIDALIKEGGKTLIIIAHRLSTIINCQRILVMEHGKVMEEGSHKDLLRSNGIYKALVERQLSNFEH